MSGRSGRGRKGRGTSQKRKAEPVEEIDVKIEPEDQSDVCPETPTSLVKTEVESRWEWQGDGGTWVVFSPQLNTLISQAFSSGKRSVTVHPAEGISLQVDFTKMMQKNTQSGFQRPVRLAVQNEDQFFVWQWQTDDHSWIPYDAETSVTLETALQSEDKLVTVNLRGLQYTMDLGNMVQKNTQTQYERQIQRSLSVADDYVEPQSQNISNGPSVKRPRKSAVSMDNEEEESKGGIMGHQASAPSTAMTCVVRSVSVPNSPVLDVELLISAVEQYPALWDTADNDYKEKNKKSYAWIQVSKRLFEDFETHSEEQQKLIKQVRTLVLKGKAPVDTECSSKLGKAHVYCEGEDVYDVMLNQTNLQFNNNKYYLIQLLEDDNARRFSVWMRWGRVGKKGQTSLVACGGDLKKAKDLFQNKFTDKTKNVWSERKKFEKVSGKYDMLQMDYNSTTEVEEVKDVKEEKKPNLPKPESKLDSRVQELLQLVCNLQTMEQTVLEMKYDIKKAPLGKLTVDQIRAGYCSLQRIENCIKNQKFGKELVEACNEFYTRVPHDFGLRTPPLIRTQQELAQKVCLLEALGDIQIAVKLASMELGSHEHPADRQYRQLHCTLEPLEHTSDTFQVHIY
uniref:NAD(+) ADP-ribosyltransferase n=1 Tax=Leptobrachium leishanense TaxID=445787 RepID=A0A8C5Q2Z2_9ANUR